MAEKTRRLRIAGVDEVGRGCIAGPVLAAAVVLDPRRPFDGLADSKQLSARQREALAGEIRSTALAWAIGRSEPGEIDSLNILQASLLAMRRAVLALPFVPDRTRVDGNHAPDLACDCETVVGGDRLIAEISAASILAKVARDAEMALCEALYPGYGFAAHKGYATAEHLFRLRARGPCPAHRLSFAPVRACMEGVIR
jgi:ribonuclease HII